MKGDFTRNTFDRTKHYQGVLLQQGRVQTDADWNEQVAITARRDATTAADLAGCCGAPADRAAFGILAAAPDGAQAPDDDFYLSAGRYYVDGIQCELEQAVLFSKQPDLPGQTLTAGTYLLYLDVWQRHLAALEDPSIREVALGGPDTATRAKTVWQVRTVPIDAPPADVDCTTAVPKFDALRQAPTAHLTADAVQNPDNDNPCLVPSSSGYLGPENQLYRVEIHRGGKANGNVRGRATYKWSRENGSVVVPLLKIEGDRLTVSSLGPDPNLGFKKGDWVEILDDRLELQNPAVPEPPFHLPQLVQIKDIPPGTTTLVLENVATALSGGSTGLDLKLHPKVRRWDGVGTARVDADTEGWQTLENGIRIRFDNSADAAYLPGQFWLIPARTASADALSGDIEWQRVDRDDPTSARAPLPPQGVHHHYCRLGIVVVGSDHKLDMSKTRDCRCLWQPLTAPRIEYVGGDGQEVMPDLRRVSGPAPFRFRLPQPLSVRVTNMQCCERTLSLRFRVTVGTGSLWLITSTSSQHPTEISAPRSAEVKVRPAAGIVSCDWYLDGTTISQEVEAALVDAQEAVVAGPILFHASLNVAKNVAYAPEYCEAMAAAQPPVRTVHDALEFLCRAARVGEPDLTRIVATSWKHGSSEADLFPILQRAPDGAETGAGVGFVIAFSRPVHVPPGDHDHVFEVLIPAPQPQTAQSGLTGGGGPSFTLLEFLPLNIYQYWCPLLTGHDPMGRPLGKIVPVDCEAKDGAVVRAVLTTKTVANGVAFLLEPDSLTYLLADKAALFDQFWIRLRCEFVLDASGRAVDGEHTRGQLPSGDRQVDGPLGIQGGLFESWFTFRGSYRGGYMIPSIVGGKQLNVTVTSFWRKTHAKMPVLFASINGGPPQFMTPQLTQNDDVTDPRYDVRVSQHVLGLQPGSPQKIEIHWDGFNRISHVPNVRLGGFGLRSGIVWDGREPVQPISLDLRKVNLNVVRGRDYQESLGASSPNRQPLTYKQELALNIVRQPPGLGIDRETGVMKIPAAETRRYTDNPANPGADLAFSGVILARDGSFVAFDGLFDGVEAG
jgi:hypothetical protein